MIPAMEQIIKRGGALGVARVDGDGSRRRVDDNRLAVGQVEGTSDADDRDDGLLTGEDRRVRGRTAVGGDQREHLRQVEQRGVGGREVARDEDEGVLGGRHTGGCHALQVRHHALADIVEVGGALPHVPAHADQQVAEGGEGLEDRALGGLAALDALVDVILEGRVLGHEGLGVEHVLGGSAGPVAAQADVRGGGREAAGRAHLLGVRGRRGGRIRGLGQRVGHPQDLADGESAADADAGEGCHLRRPGPW